MTTSTVLADIEFRVASAADAPCIGVLGAQVFLDAFAPQGIHPRLAAEVLEYFTVEQISKELASPSAVFIVAELRSCMIGFAQLDSSSPQALAPPGPTVELHRLYVQPKFLGQGVGRALLGRAEAWATTRGAASVWLTNWVENSRATAFFARQGYVDLGAGIYETPTEKFENRIMALSLPSGESRPT